MHEPMFTETLQVSLVVRDLDATNADVRRRVRHRPLGDLRVQPEHGERHAPPRRARCVVRQLAIAQVGQVQWELVEPLDDESIYAQFLATNGPASITSASASPSYDDTLVELAGRGRDVLLGGEYNGLTFAYLSTDDDLGVITEIFSGAPGADQEPDRRMRRWLDALASTSRAANQRATVLDDRRALSARPPRSRSCRRRGPRCAWSACRPGRAVRRSERRDARFAMDPSAPVASSTARPVNAIVQRPCTIRPGSPTARAKSSSRWIAKWSPDASAYRTV